MPYASVAERERRMLCSVRSVAFFRKTPRVCQHAGLAMPVHFPYNGESSELRVSLQGVATGEGGASLEVRLIRFLG